MIGMVLRFVTNPLGIAVLGVASTGIAYKVGTWNGHRAGVADQIAAQAEADAEASVEIRERVRNALEEIGGDASSVDVDRILRSLAGDAGGDN